jgi:hypothetical protein
MMNTNRHSLDKRSAAFALAAAIAVLFNTALAWVKDAYDPLNKFMAHLFGHHWTTHGLFDLAVFAALGLLFSSSGVASRIEPQRLVTMLFAAVVLAGLGLAAWFLLY